jgi:argininosuccinate lyase
MKSSTKILKDIIPSLKIREDIFMNSTVSFSTSTELANMLVRKYSVPFRTSHKMVGFLTRTLYEKGKSLSDVNSEILASIAEKIMGKRLEIKSEDIRTAVNPETFIESHNVLGGPAKVEVERRLKNARLSLKSLRKIVTKEIKRLTNTKETLRATVKEYEAS